MSGLSNGQKKKIRLLCCRFAVCFFMSKLSPISDADEAAFQGGSLGSSRHRVGSTVGCNW